MNYDNRFNGGGGSRAVSTTRDAPRAAARQDVAVPDFGVSELGTVKVGGVALVPTSVAEIAQFATMMAGAGKMVRKHLRDQPNTCLGLCMQAFRWGMDPFMVANASYEVNDQIAYEAKLLNAVIIQNAPIVGRPVFTYTGEGQNRRCKVEVVTRDGQNLSLETPPKGQIKPQNSPLWTTDPDQQLSYYAIRALSRRSFPDILMGCYDVEEAEAGVKDVTPPGAAPKVGTTAALDRFAARRGGPVVDGTPDLPAEEPEPEQGNESDEVDHDEDGVIGDDEIEGDPEAPAIVVPQMPDDALALWQSKGRWSPAWKWLDKTAKEVDQPVLAHILLTHADVLDAAAAHNEAGAAAVAELKKKAGLE